MSLINRQQLLWAQSEREDALHRISVGEDSQRVKDLLNSANKRITKFEKELAREEAEAQAKRKAEEEKKSRGRDNYNPKKERPGFPADQELPCVDCGSAFTFTGKDQLFFEKQGYAQPSRCSDCREAKKNAKPTGADLTCSDCENTFFFSDSKARVFEEKGWEQPKRCYDCSVTYKSMAPVLINCGGCSKDFSFSVKAQKDFKAKGWTAPKNCRYCIRVKHEKKDAASVKSGSQKASVK